MNQIEKLVDELETIYGLQSFYRVVIDEGVDSPLRRKAQEKLEELHRDEKIIDQKLLLLDGCEHLNAEDTGGPDGSQVCLDCGKVW